MAKTSFSFFPLPQNNQTKALPPLSQKQLFLKANPPPAGDAPSLLHAAGYLSSTETYLLSNGQNISMPRVKLSLAPQFHYLTYDHQPRHDTWLLEIATPVQG